MVSFTTATSALVLLASTVNASFETIANYGPASQVTDHVSQPPFFHKIKYQI